MSNAFDRMDEMYRRQRHFYDLTRKYYLFGRDRLLAEMRIQAGENVLEVGCGTGRNLIILAEKHPAANFYGLDASGEMLRTARTKIDARKLKNITLKHMLADAFDARETFGLNEPFDAIFFSYSISMIPTWKESIKNALPNLKPNRSFYIVDFFDQRDLPAWFRKVLKGWLRRFHVQFWGDLLPHLESLEKQGAGNLTVTSIARRYAFLAEFKKSG